MLAMHYRIPLTGSDAVATVRRRAVERGPLFDHMDGLAHKFFLVDAADPTYATFYLWRDVGAAQAFLDGPFFAALAATFGRPPVRLLLASAIDIPAQDPDMVTLVEGLHPHAFGPRIDAVDPGDGAPLSLRFDGAVRGRRFDLLYHARGTAAAFVPARRAPSTRAPVLNLF